MTRVEIDLDVYYDRKQCWAPLDRAVVRSITAGEHVTVWAGDKEAPAAVDLIDPDTNRVYFTLNWGDFA